MCLCPYFNFCAICKIFCDVIYRTLAMLNIFIGAPQSKYSAMAILAAIIIVSLTMLLGKEPIPLSQKFAMVLLIFLISLPGILLTLFQMTCLVTGAGFRNQRWWCSAYAWILSGLLILYCIFLIVVAVMTLTTGEKVMVDIANMDAENFEAVMQKANAEAVKMFSDKNASSEQVVSMPEKKKEVDTFKVQGGASVPASIMEEPVVAPVTPGAALAPSVEPAPMEAEGFSSCGFPF